MRSRFRSVVLAPAVTVLVAVATLFRRLAQVWGDVYDRAGDILSIQAEIAREVAGTFADAYPLRPEPRYQRLLARVGLPESLRR